MADAANLITPTVRRISGDKIVYTWSKMGGNSTGAMVDLSKYLSRSIQVFAPNSVGAYGGATLTLYGSHDENARVDLAAGTLFGAATAQWGEETDPLGNNIAISSGSLIKEILAFSEYITPVCSGGTGTNLTVVIVGSRNKI